MRYHTIGECNFVIDVNFMFWFLLSVDGCKNYKVLNEADRAQNNTLRNNTRCDDNLVTGWYRFQGAAGDRMADKCPPQFHCGTEDPGWLSGTHPTVAEGVVARTVCYNRSGDCCFWSNIIKVKNCGSYYVYELQQPPTCNLRYCGNGGAGKLHLISEWLQVKHKMKI